MLRKTLKEQTFIFALIAFLLCTISIPAQNESVIQGTVVDSKRMILPGAAVFIKKAGASSESTVYTNEEGKFDFPNLSKGQYEIRVELDGFQTITAEISLENSAARTVQITLPQAQNVQESVTVTADNSEFLQKEETQHKEEISEQTLNYAPTASSRFQDALPLIPSDSRYEDIQHSESIQST